MLERLFEVGINRKLWRLLKNCYEEVSCYVKIDGKSSEKFKVERGVRQGSVLSPSLFLLASDGPSVEAAGVIRFGIVHQ